MSRPLKKKPGKKSERKVNEKGYIPQEFIDYYREQFVPSLLTSEEFNLMIDIFRQSLHHVIRIIPTEISNQLKSKMDSFISEHQEKLNCKQITTLDDRFGFIYQLNVDNPTLRKDDDLQPFREWLSKNSQFGYIARQELVSMIPPFFLDLKNDSSVLDCCASPGSKTSQIINIITNGLLVANDVNINRCFTLTHNLNRYNTYSTITTAYPAQYLPELGQFDRILCDVPCSGDGTLRKNPDAINKWSTSNGSSLHTLQRAILIRALQLLSIGGRLVYSTCSLNPIEDEAVINSTLLETGDSVILLDCRKEFPSLVSSAGLKDWKVVQDENTVATMNPQPQIQNLEYCMRFFPHQNDSGGFFVAVLQKLGNINVEVPKLPHKPLPKWKEPPFVKLSTVSNEVAESIKNDFGLTSDFDSERMFVRAENVVNNIYYLSKEVAEIVNSIPSDQLRAVLCGTRIFTWKSLSDKSIVRGVPCMEGTDVVRKFASKRIVNVSAAVMKRMILSAQEGVNVGELPFYDEVKDQRQGGYLFNVEGSALSFGGIILKGNVVIYLKKEHIQSEVFKLEQMFPNI
ncbi:NOL1/NOP2/sun family protein [Histomonas meleagridis]|uniref:NOL1/NOP2/sun family protein n=1 Tax=Histomonas meleagridis TaxID=135588 RepID=UPI0035596D5F|nr:NOL1/NOP2/sun family protein [Histomonas meleagridis]KAH0798202.1 NOL1/NOP2/sun family protein [Histomonas meleagridis]